MARIHCFTHVPFEGPGTIEAWAEVREHDLRVIEVFAGEALPEPSATEPLIVMGGPMSAYDDEEHPWLVDEKRCIARTIDIGGGVLGICLGAQLVAEVLGGDVVPLGQSEVGWWPVSLDESIGPLAAFPPETVVFHWHSDTFTLPPGCLQLASSAACEQQAFCYDDGRVLALQFHPELEISHIAAIVERCGADLEASEFVQLPEQFLAGEEYPALVRDPLWNTLDTFLARVTGASALQTVG